MKNAGTEPETLKIDILKFSAYEDTGKPALHDLEPTDTFDDWVTFSEPTFSVLPEEWKTITATFTVPEEASFGYYYAFVFTRVRDQEDLAPKETAVIGGTATLVLLEAGYPVRCARLWSPSSKPTRPSMNSSQSTSPSA